MVVHIKQGTMHMLAMAYLNFLVEKGTNINT